VCVCGIVKLIKQFHSIPLYIKWLETLTANYEDDTEQNHDYKHGYYYFFRPSIMYDIPPSMTQKN